MGKIADIEAEFDESFSDVIKGFAIMGYSRTATADILEINLSYFRQLCKKYNLHRHFKKQKDMLPECRGKGVPRKRGGWPKGQKRPFKARKYTDQEILQEVARWPKFQEFQAWSFISPSTVSRRFKVKWKVVVMIANNQITRNAA